jgi:single-strand DNA-binding protein
MSNDTTITVVGNLTADPELKFFPSGKSVANFTIASTPRLYDKNTGQWTDGDPLFLRCNLWSPYAENAVETLGKGMQVLAAGRLKQRSYETSEGEKRSVFELDVEDIGPTLRFAVAKVTKATRAPRGDAPAVQRSNGTAPESEWATAGAGSSGGWGASQSGEPPF